MRLQQSISKYVKEKKIMFELQSCKITGREKRGDLSNMFTVHIASYESTFVDEHKEVYA